MQIIVKWHRMRNLEYQNTAQHNANSSGAAEWLSDTQIIPFNLKSTGRIRGWVGSRPDTRAAEIQSRGISQPGSPSRHSILACPDNNLNFAENDSLSPPKAAFAAYHTRVCLKPSWAHPTPAIAMAEVSKGETNPSAN